MDTTDKLIARIEQLVLEKKELSQLLESQHTINCESRDLLLAKWEAAEATNESLESQVKELREYLEQGLSELRKAQTLAREWEECHKLLKADHDKMGTLALDWQDKYNESKTQVFLLRKDITSMKEEGDTLVQERDTLRKELIQADALIKRYEGAMKVL